MINKKNGRLNYKLMTELCIIIEAGFQHRINIFLIHFKKGNFKFLFHNSDFLLTIMRKKSKLRDINTEFYSIHKILLAIPSVFFLRIVSYKLAIVS